MRLLERPYERHSARERFDTVVLEMLEEVSVLPVAPSVDGQAVCAVVVRSLRQGDPSRGEEGPHPVVPGPAVDEADVVGCREGVVVFIRGRRAVGEKLCEQSRPGGLVYCRGVGDDPVEVEDDPVEPVSCDDHFHRQAPPTAIAVAPILLGQPPRGPFTDSWRRRPDSLGQFE